MRSAFDCKHVKGVRAIALTWEGKHAGRIVANYSDNPAGSVCTASICMWAGPLAEMPAAHGSAGGYGYDKFSGAVYDAFQRINGHVQDASATGTTKAKDGPQWLDMIRKAGLGHGNGGTETAFRALGYDYLGVC